MNKELTKEEKSLLLYAESCSVDNSGFIDNRRVNGEDILLLKKWNNENFVSCKRVCMAVLNSRRKSTGEACYESIFIKLSEEAWITAHQLRKERAERMRLKIIEKYDGIVTTEDLQGETNEI
ncbi:MAG: hypothetical protein WC942_10405 [Clostridia bacterium]|jgi:hypothetical protein